MHFIIYHFTSEQADSKCTKHALEVSHVRLIYAGARVPYARWVNAICLNDAIVKTDILLTLPVTATASSKPKK